MPKLTEAQIAHQQTIDLENFSDVLYQLILKTITEYNRINTVDKDKIMEFN
jgi:hypothetical protein